MYNCELSIIVGLKLAEELQALRSKFTGEDLSNLEAILTAGVTSKDGKLVRYHVLNYRWMPMFQPSVKAVMDILQPRLEDADCDASEEGYEASFIRIPEPGEGGIEYYGDSNIQYIDIVYAPEF